MKLKGKIVQNRNKINNRNIKKATTTRNTMETLKEKIMCLLYKKEQQQQSC